MREKVGERVLRKDRTVQILPKEMDEYFTITLKHVETHVQTLIYISDLYLIAYRVYEYRSLIGFTGEKPVTVYNLPFTGSYTGGRNFFDKGVISRDMLPLLELVKATHDLFTLNPLHTICSR